MKYFVIIIVFVLTANYSIADSIPPIKKALPIPSGIVTSSKKSDDTKKDFDWNNLVSALMGGLIGLSPSIISYFKKTKSKGKIRSQYGCFGTVQGGVNVSIILQKVSIFAENKSFFLKDFDIYVKYPSSTEIKCKNWTWRAVEFTFNQNGINVQKKLNIDKKEYLLHFTILPKEQSVIGYISFTIDSVLDEKFDYVRYVFKDYRGIVKELKIDKTEIIENTQIFDDTIWI